MALEFEFAITAVQADCSENTLTDNTVYGNGELERHQLANYTVAAKMDVEGTPSYLTLGTHDFRNTTGLAVLDDYVPTSFTFPTTKDGWYQFLVVSAEMYLNTTTYTAGTVVGEEYKDGSIVYDPADGNFYYCIQNNDNGNQQSPSGTTGYWTLISTDFTVVANQTVWLGIISGTDGTGNPNVFNIHEHNDLVTCYGEDCLTEQLEKAVDGNMCKDCDEILAKKTWQKLDVLINGAYAKNYQERSAEAEEIMRYVEDICASC